MDSACGQLENRFDTIVYAGSNVKPVHTDDISVDALESVRNIFKRQH